MKVGGEASSNDSRKIFVFFAYYYSLSRSKDDEPNSTALNCEKNKEIEDTFSLIQKRFKNLSGTCLSRQLLCK
jgi:hypothetical protein